MAITIDPQDIDARAQVLIAEFHAHYAAAKSAAASPQDYDRAFQGWAIQQIAYLQLCVLKFETILNARSNNL